MNHSLKEGMKLVGPTKEQAKLIFKLAKERGIIQGGSGAVLPDIWYPGANRISYCVSAPLRFGQEIVTFEQFVAAMVTPPIPVKEEKKEEEWSIEKSVRDVNEGIKTFSQLLHEIECQKRVTISDDLIIESLKAENESLRLRLEKQVEVEKVVDNRFDFGEDDVRPDLKLAAYVGRRNAKKGDSGKVLISHSDHEWQLIPDYYQGRSAVQLVKIK